MSIIVPSPGHADIGQTVRKVGAENHFSVARHRRRLEPGESGRLALDVADLRCHDQVEVRRSLVTATKPVKVRSPIIPDLVARDDEVQLDAGSVRLSGHLEVPSGATAIVIFVHGSGSSRHSPRNRYVARVLNEAGLGTLLFDLLTSYEERDRANVFDIPLLASRLRDVTAWLRDLPGTGDARLGYFGASTGAAAALWAAAEPDADVAAVVSRGGRPDLAIPRLAAVHAPTLLIVGGRDVEVLALNREAQAHLRCPSDLAIVPGATHLFEERGALESVAAYARAWFASWLGAPPPTLGGQAPLEVRDGRADQPR
jgi:putative phosphoribosyl transferase